MTYCRREGGHPGGVPKWAWHLKRALEEAGHRVDHHTWRDYPGWREHNDAPEHEKARLLSSRLAGERRDYGRIVADGFWACGLPDDAPVTVVCHGTWAGLAAACGGVDGELIAAQGVEYRRFPVVAVSESAARQVKRYHGADVAAVIPNGIDLAAFKPVERPPNDPPVVLYAGRGYAKGEDVVREMRRLLGQEADARERHSRASVALRAMEPKGRLCHIEHLNAPPGMEARAFQRGDVFVFPSRHEGDSYALKEATACGLPAVASAVGALASERPAETCSRGRRIGEIVEGFAAADYCAALERVIANNRDYQPRRWAEKHAGFGEFARRWREYLA